MPIPAAIGAALITGGASLANGILGNIFQSNSASRSNAFNARQAQLNRDFSALEASKQRRFESSEAELLRNWQSGMYQQQNLDAIAQWERENAEYDRRLADQAAYESPSAQRMRYIQAGINPALAMSNGTSLGSVTNPTGANLASAPSGASATGSAASGGSAATAVTPQYVPFDLSSAVNSSLIAAQTEGVILDNKFKDARNIAEITKTFMEAGVNAHQAQLLAQQIFEARDTYQERKRKIGLDSDASEAGLNLARQALKTEQEKTRSLQIANDIAEIDKKYADENWQSILANAWMQVMVSDSTIALNDALKAKAFADRVVSLAQADGLRIDNEDKKELNRAALAKLRSEIVGQRLSNQGQRIENFNNTHDMDFGVFKAPSANRMANFFEDDLRNIGRHRRIFKGYLRNAIPWLH